MMPCSWYTSCVKWTLALLWFYPPFLYVYIIADGLLYLSLII